MPASTARVTRLSLANFRAFVAVDARFDDGLTILRGANGTGKTSLLEAVAWACRGRSFRGVPDHVLVRAGEPDAILRAEFVTGERHQEVAAEIRPDGPTRIRLNHQSLHRRRDLGEVANVTVFAPDDLQLVKGGPVNRREFLDELLAAMSPRLAQALADYERVLRQRNALLKSGVTDRDGLATLDVFDDQLARAGGQIQRGRLRLAARLAPAVHGSYAALATPDATVTMRYRSEVQDAPLAEDDDFEASLREALRRTRAREVDRRVTLVGPHRDEWVLSIDGLDARLHASQGEQRSLALSLRLAGHLAVDEVTGSTPILLLDDVFSELDPYRSAALVHRLPAGQTLLTTADHVPAEIDPQRCYEVVDRTVREVAA